MILRTEKHYLQWDRLFALLRRTEPWSLLVLLICTALQSCRKTSFNQNSRSFLTISIDGY